MRIENEFFHEILDDIEEYIPRLIKSSESISELLYEPITEESMEIFGRYLQALVDFSQTMIVTLEDAKEHLLILYENVTPIFQEIIKQTANLEVALTANQFIDVADILKYELTVKLASMLLEIKESRI